jgi:hypothetical protein
MAKKQYTPEEFKAKIEKSNAKKENFSKVFLSSIAILLSLVITFSVVSLAFTYVGKAGQTTVVSGQVNNGGSTNVDANVPSDDATVPGDDVTDVPSDDATAPEDDATVPGDDNAADAPAGETNSDQAALDMFKKAVAAARTKSKSVVRVKDGAINYKGHVKAGGLSSAATTLMGMFMAKDEASIEAKNEAWDKTKLPDASALTLNGVQKITCVDKGSTYVVTVVAKDAVNPKANADGVGSIAGVIEESQITGSISSVPGLKLSNIKIAYENVTAVATIDKATGNLVALNLDAPCILGLDAKLALISIDGAEVGIEVFTEYKISY